MSTSLRSRARGFQRLPSLNYYNVLHKYVRTIVNLLFSSPVVLPHYITWPSLASAVIELTVLPEWVGCVGVAGVVWVQFTLSIQFTVALHRYGPLYMSAMLVCLPSPMHFLWGSLKMLRLSWE